VVPADAGNAFNANNASYSADCSDANASNAANAAYAQCLGDVQQCDEWSECHFWRPSSQQQPSLTDTVDV